MGNDANSRLACFYADQSIRCEKEAEEAKQETNKEEEVANSEVVGGDGGVEVGDEDDGAAVGHCLVRVLQRNGPVHLELAVVVPRTDAVPAVHQLASGRCRVEVRVELQETVACKQQQTHSIQHNNNNNNQEHYESRAKCSGEKSIGKTFSTFSL